MIRRPPRSTLDRSSAASDVYKRQPLTCPEVPEDVLEPSNSWGNKDEYWKKYDALAARFVENFKLFEKDTSDEVKGAGPKRFK